MTNAPDTRKVPEFTIGDRLRKARLSMGDQMDVRAFAELLGTSRNTITNYELEHTPAERMKLMVLRQWAMATGVDLGWLRTGRAEREGDGGPAGRGVRPEGFEPPTYCSVASPRQVAA